MRHSYHIQSHMQPRPFDDTGTDTNTDVVCNELRVSIRADTDHGATAARSEKRYGNGELTWGDGLEGEGRRAVAAARRARGGRGRRRGGGGRGGEPLLVAPVEGGAGDPERGGHGQDDQAPPPERRRRRRAAPPAAHHRVLLNRGRGRERARVMRGSGEIAALPSRGLPRRPCVSARGACQ